MNKIAQFLTSFKISVIGLLVFAGYRLFETQAMFYRYLPLQENIRLVASVLVAFIVVFSLLVFSAHIDRFKLTKYGSGEWIKRVLFFFTLFINAFFWEVWTADENPNNLGLVIGFKITMTVFLAIFDYAYNHLFISLWFEKQEEERVNLSVDKLLNKESNLKQSISKQQASLKQLIAKQDPKVCPRCGTGFANLNQRNGHLRGCKK